VDELAGRGLAGGDQAFEVVSFSFGKDNGILEQYTPWYAQCLPSRIHKSETALLKFR
jgi:hypothetical protein